MTVLVDDPDLTLHVGDALEITRGLPDQSFDAVVTSPPYADAREDVPCASAQEYVEWFAPFLVEIQRTLKPGGGFMLNLGRRFEDGVESDYVERTLLRAQEIGWKRIDTVVWGKINGRPVNPYLTNKHEVIYWLTTGARPLDAFRGYGEEIRYPYPVETLARYQRNWINGTNVKGEESIQGGRTPHEDGARPGSIYVTQVGKEKGIKHPTPMALDLARFLVCLSCPRGGVVLDPFFGSGATARAARLHGRRCVGIERNPVFAAEAASLLSQQALT